MICKILNILKIFMITLYLIFSLLMLAIISLIMNVMNLLLKGGTIEITIHLIQWMLIFRKRKTMNDTKKIRWETFNIFDRKGPTLCRWFVSDKELTKYKARIHPCTIFLKTAYYRPLAPNFESMDKTTNPYSKNPRDTSVAENESEFSMV